MPELDYRRLKTSRGRFPVAGVELRNSAQGEAEIMFEFSDEPTGGGSVEGSFSLEALACSLPIYPLDDQDELVERIGGVARECGPLLGSAEPESVADWMCEIRFAQAALGMQRAINGDAPLDAPGISVVKSVVRKARDGKVAFTSYCLSLVSGVGGSARLERTFPRMPWMKRFSDEGACDYAFVCADAGGAQHVIDIHLIAFPEDIPTVDYSFMTGYFEALGHDVSGLGDEFEAGGAPGAPAKSTLAKPGGTHSEPTALERADAPHLQHLVHALIALHTEPVHVDLFKSDGSRDFLAFDTYLSSLWYDFAMRLGQVKMGYCVQCGRGFSLTGHRGMTKEYCSEACRTQAKNERRRVQLTRARELFMRGSSVAEAAREAYPGMGKRAAEDAVRRGLRQWPALKRAVEDDLSSGDGALTKRCVEEGAVDPDWLARKARAHAKRRKRSGR